MTRPSDEIVIRDAERSLTSDQLRTEVYAVAGVLQTLGLGLGSRLGLLVENTCAALTVRYAASLIGCVTVYLPDADDAVRLTDFLAETAVDDVLVTPGRAAHLAAALRFEGAPLVGVLSAGPVPAERLEAVDVLALAETVDAVRPAVDVPPDALGCLVTSGGTTGHPKASLRTQADWTAVVTGPEDERRRQLVCTPLAYVAQVQSDQTLVGGGSVVLRPPTVPFDAAGVLATIEAEQITHLCVVEPALVELLDHEDLTSRDLRSLRAIAHIGADICSNLRARLCARVRAAGLGDLLVHTYGSSEVGLVSLLAGSDYREAPSTAGRLLPGVEVRLDGVDPQSGEGEIVVRSAGVCRGTTRFPRTQDDPAWESEWTRRTGDWGSFDPAGRLTIRGRIGDAVAVPEGLLFPVDAQQVLCSHPDVRYAVALPVRPAGRSPEGFVATVTLRPGADTTAAELMRFVAARDPRVPVHGVRVVADVPVTEQGKPDRRLLANGPMNDA